MRYKAIIFDFAGTLFYDLCCLAPGATELLQYCKEQGFKMAGVTAGTYDASRLDEIGLYKYLEVIKILDQAEGKTPQVFKTVLNQLNVMPENAIGVGDLLHREIRGMKQLGMLTIWIQNGWRNNLQIEDNEKPDYIANDLYQVKKIIQKLGQY